MKLIVGLGNPGAKYAENRHNIGFMALDRIAEDHGFAPWRPRFQALTAEGRLGEMRVTLLKPQTFMNLSGQSVGEAMRFHKLSPQDVVILYDELDLAPGKLRVKTGGGSGGHNGIKSLDAHCGKEYRRVRIGIGHPGAKHLVTSHVLGDFAKVDAEWLDPLLESMADQAEFLVRGDDPGFMSKVAQATRGKTPPSPAPLRPAPAPKGQSQIRQARPKGPAVKPPESGPLAAMLKKLFNRD